MLKRKRNSDFRKELNLTAETDPDFEAEVTNIYSLPFSCIEYYGSMVKDGPKGFLGGCGNGDDEIISGSEDENDKENQNVVNLSDNVIISDSEDECDHRKYKRLKRNIRNVSLTETPDSELTNTPLDEFVKILNATVDEPSFSDTLNSELGNILDSIEKENRETKEEIMESEKEIMEMEEIVESEKEIMESKEIVVRRRGLEPCKVVTKNQIRFELKKLLPIKIRYIQQSERIVEPLVHHVFRNVIFKTVKIFGTIVGEIWNMNKGQIGFCVLDGTDIITCYYPKDDRLDHWKTVPKEYDLVNSRTELYLIKRLHPNEESQAIINMGLALVNTIENQSSKRIIQDKHFETHTCVSVIGNVSEFFDEKVIYVRHIEKVPEDDLFPYKQSFDKLVEEIFAKSSD